MTTMHLKVVHLFPMLTAALLAAGCSDSTGPSKLENTDVDSSALLPTDSSDTLGGSQLPHPEPGEAPKVNWPAPGEMATQSSKPSFFIGTASWRTAYAPGPGTVIVPEHPAVCFGPPFARAIVVADLVVTRSSGLSAADPYTKQYVTGEIWFFRYDSARRAWVPQATGTTTADMTGANWPGGLPEINKTLSTVTYKPLTAGLYNVAVRLTWWAFLGGQWVKTAGGDYNLNATSDYYTVGGTEGPGYCQIY